MPSVPDRRALAISLLTIDLSARRLLRWAALLTVSAAFGLGLDRAGLPGALLLGPMLAGIGFACLGMKDRVPRRAFVLAQGVVGCLIASAVTADLLADILRDWPVMLLAVAMTVLASGTVGWLTARYGSLPGSTAAWGSSPGAASAMTAMAEDYGADIRLVAFMQYLRVICVVATASVVSRFLAGSGGAVPAVARPGAAAADLPWAHAVLATVVVVAAGSWIGSRWPVPAGGLLVPLALGAVLNSAGIVPITLPDPLLIAAYGTIGWFIGLQFDRAIILRSLRALPQVLLATFGMIALCGLSAWLLTRLRGSDPLTAFLATTPGGIDSVAIIAVGGHAEVGFVLALQSLRLIVVILAGPWLARTITRTAASRA